MTSFGGGSWRLHQSNAGARPALPLNIWLVSRVDLLGGRRFWTEGRPSV
jgi:hypothetical protein